MNQREVLDQAAAWIAEGKASGELTTAEAAGLQVQVAGALGRVEGRPIQVDVEAGRRRGLGRAIAAGADPVALGLAPGPDALAREDAARDVARLWAGVSAHYPLTRSAVGEELAAVLDRLALLHELTIWPTSTAAREAYEDVTPDGVSIRYPGRAGG